jgi:hypothetical protein
VLSKTGIALGEAIHFEIINITWQEQTMDNCSRCDQELDEIYWRDEDSKVESVFDLVVLKCPRCKAVYAYLIDNSAVDNDDISDNTSPMNGHSYPMIKNPKKNLPKKCAGIYSKSVKEHEHRTEELNKLIQSKITQLYGVGLSLATVNLARGEIVRYTKGNITTKKLTALLAAAIYAKANTTTTNGSLWKHKGEGVTERQLEEIFGISRKTIRKWADKFC